VLLVVPRAAASQASVLRAILLCVVAYGLIAVSDVFAKLALARHGVGDLILVRGLLGTLLLGAASTWHAGARVLWPRRPWPLMLRSVLHCVGSACWYYAFARMSLADAYALGYATPLLMTLLAIPLLGEQVGWRRWASTLVGFMGVLVMVRPGGAFWTPVVLVLFAGVVLVALTRIMARQLAQTERADAIVFWMLVLHIPFGAAWVLVTGMATPNLASSGAFLGMAVTNIAGHIVMTRAYALSPLSILAPYEYTTFLWALGFGAMIWGETPEAVTLLGAAIVVGAGLYNLHRERLRRRQELAA
jgi:drug/metabolite transporter (DMT)-like permease